MITPVDYPKIITIEPGKRGGKPCIRRMRITVGDILGWLAGGITRAQIVEDFPELTHEDIAAALASPLISPAEAGGYRREDAARSAPLTQARSVA